MLIRKTYTVHSEYSSSKVMNNINKVTHYRHMDALCNNNSKTLAKSLSVHSELHPVNIEPLKVILHLKVTRRCLCLYSITAQWAFSTPTYLVFCFYCQIIQVFSSRELSVKGSRKQQSNLNWQIVKVQLSNIFLFPRSPVR